MQRLKPLKALLLCAVVAAALCPPPAAADEGAWRNAISQGADAVAREDHAGAVVQFGHAVAAAQAFGPDDARLAESHYRLGHAHRALLDYPLAEQNFLRALVIVETTPVPNFSLADVLDALGDVHRMQGRHREAESVYMRALLWLEQAHGTTHPLVAQALSNNLASLYRVLGRFAEAEAAYVRAVAILEQSVPADDKRLGLARIDLAEWHYEHNRYAEAEALYRRGIPVVQKSLPPAHPRVLELLQDWGRVQQLQGHYAVAEATYNTMLRLTEQHHGKDHPLIAAALSNLAGVYAVQGREVEARAARARAQQVAELPFRTYPALPGLMPPVRKLSPFVLGPAMPQPAPSEPASPAFTTQPQPPLRFPPAVRPELLQRRR